MGFEESLPGRSLAALWSWLGAMGRRFSVPRLPPTQRAQLFTNQVFASRSQPSAERARANLEQTGVRAESSGVFDRRDSAGRALGGLRKKWKIHGFV
jgi:hypothetical protein